MKGRNFLMNKRAKLLIIAAMILVLAGAVYALDPPHTPEDNVTCTNCHQNNSAWFAGGSIDNTPLNMLCLSCHNQSGSAPAVQTHSGQVINDATYWSGQWTNECRTCHDPHYQDQPRRWGIQSALVTGYVKSISGITSASGPAVTADITMTKDGATPFAWTNNQWVGYEIKPNGAYQFYYRITANTASAVTVKLDNSVSIAGKPRGLYYLTRYAPAGSKSWLLYGHLIKDVIDRGRPIVNSSGVVFDSNTAANVMYFNSSGPYSPADSDTDTTAICVVCHTQTKHKNIGFSKFSTRFDSKPTYTHYNSTTQSCWASGCHTNHLNGFKPNCGGCHGTPPTSDTTVIGSLPTFGPTGRTTQFPGTAAGAHDFHVNTKGFACVNCHSGGEPTGGPHNVTTSPSPVIIGFDLNDMYTTGTYNAPAYANSNYTLESGHAGTTVTLTGTKQVCSFYCHGSTLGASMGNNTAPVWNGGSSQAQCGTCHKATAADPPQLGSHAAHTGNNSIMAPLACDVCHGHDGSGANHVNGYVNWNFNTTDVRVANARYNGTASGQKGPVPSSSYNSCSNVYCHSNANPYGGTNVYTSPTWGGASVTCGSCHSATGSSPKHTKHTVTYGFACSTCHNKTIYDGAGNSTISNKTMHVNGTKDVIFNSLNAGGTFSNHTCSNIYCHSAATSSTAPYPAPNNTPEWSTSLPADCTGCHNGDKTAAVTMASGSHTKHVKVYGFACGKCHAATVSTANNRAIATTANHVNKLINIAIDASVNNGATYNGTATPMTKKPGSAYGACNNVYCHSNGNTGAMVYNTITWGTSITTCNRCHGTGTANGMPNHATGTGLPNSHPKHVTANGISCSECHYATTTTGTTITNTSMHDNGTINVVFNSSGYNKNGSFNASNSQCSSTYCHGSGTPQWGGSVVCGSCHAVNSTLAGRHSTHYSVSTNAADRSAADNSTVANYIFNCGTCHNNTHHAGGPVSASQTAEVIFNATIAGSGTYTAGTPQGADPNGFNYTGGSCSTTYCHSNGNGGAPNVTAFNWSSPAGTLTCKGCHGYTAASGTPISSGSHTKHINSIYSFNCSTCHYGTTNNGTSITNKVLHVNHVKNVIWNSVNAGGSAYVSPNCTNIYCHSSATSNAAPYPAPNNTPTWGSSLPTDCTGCHSGDKTAAKTMSTGAHTTHVGTYGFACGKCHSATVSTASNRAIATPANHVNKLINIAIDASVNNGATYAGVATPMTKTPGTAHGSCSNVYCHSDGNPNTSARVYNTISWDGSIGTACNRCHGTTTSNGMPDHANAGMGVLGSNSHPMHVATQKISCSECHYATTTTGTTITNTSVHDNGAINVIFNASGLNKNGAFNASTQTCSNVYCHSNGLGTYKQPTWGGAVTCTSCHDFPPADGAHLTHIQNASLLTQAYGNTEIKSDKNSYAFGCGNCHPTDPSKHADGVIEISLNPADGGVLKSKNASTAYRTGTGLTTVCNQIYCHSNGASGPGSNLSTAQSPQWGSTLGTNECGGCHGNPPQYASAGAGVAGANSHYDASYMGAEGGHLVGIHFDDIFNKVSGSGLLTTGTTTESSHGNASVATTITCYVCHYQTASSATIDTYAMDGTSSKFKCGTCHTSSTPTKLQHGVIIDKTKHVYSGTPIVAFAPITVNSKAQLRNASLPSQWKRNGTYGVAGSYDSTVSLLNTGTWTPASKTCVVACHNGNSVQWGDTGVTCVSCHNQL